MSLCYKNFAFFMALTVWYFWVNSILSAFPALHTSHWFNENVNIPLNRLPTCELDKSLLVGRFYVNKTVPRSFQEVKDQLKFVNHGGWWKPKYCKTVKSVAIIIAYRNREANLRTLLVPLHKLLRRQQLNYRVFLAEQWDKHPFNKGKLFNAGFKVSQEFGNYDCNVMHDADYIPEDDRNMYDCPTSPRHMAPFWEGYQYHGKVESFMGGILAFTTKDYKEMNGWSNRFYGWGGEDDDMFTRIKLAGKRVTKPGAEGRYGSGEHKPAPRNQERHKLKQDTQSKNYKLFSDGLSNLNYILVGTEEKELYTHLKIDLDMKPSEYAFTSLNDKKDYSKL